jgi:hypothetical protein
VRVAARGPSNAEGSRVKRRESCGRASSSKTLRSFCFSSRRFLAKISSAEI